ncbi:MAG TPA: DNA polymerase domain-containing protein [Ktedonobacteraceae bacterium]|nr:DNA polymerase domain-containing protein [Ktedonobacteraceae bacterium]
MPGPISSDLYARSKDEYVFGWDSLPGIVSVWASRDGRAVLWRRESERVSRFHETFRPWLFATTLDDLAHLGATLTISPVEWHTDTSLVSYRILDGSDGSYRYLLSARDGRFLERTLLKGASRRLGHNVSSLSELSDTYYQVGPVEQYLMQTGRTYFQGLNYEDLHRLQFDLETTSLDPHRGRIFLISIRDSRGFATTLEAPQPEDEAKMIGALCQLIQERDPDIIENHNLFSFDLQFLEYRAGVLGISLRLGRSGGPERLERREETLAIGPEARRRVRYSVAGRELIDTLDAVRRYDFVVRDLPSHGLKDVARYFHIASSDRVYLEGATIYETYRTDPDTVRRYALDDVQEVDGLSRRLLGASFALAKMAPRRYERLASAGPAMGILEPMLVRAYLRAGVALPRQTTESDPTHGPHEGGAVYLFATGIAEHVVKADVASLYPSLMRSFRIGPSCDHLGVLLDILDRLTDLRLAHKAAAKNAVPGSLEANMHDATQAAMKILINAAYGYMGAGSMALFADIHAADEVTRRGREVLTHVLDALRQRGMALIEADTDGVYFAVPVDWTEEQERQLVAEIGAELPAGIRLEYEGRYRAMFSHEVKNYALLTYDGQLVVHGVALRSSRSEPFGEQFLRQALLYTMTGDVMGAREAFLATVEALRQRKYPASDLAARVRLSKSPETYQVSRAGHMEQAYEALLAANRSKWTPGERVRFYRASGGASVWIPDESEAISFEEADPPEGGARTNEANNSFVPVHADAIKDRRDYDVEHYLRVLVTSYASRLRKAYAAEDFAQLFRSDEQLSLFDSPIEQISPIWIRCQAASGD